jgi:hypothetical protein
MAEANGKEGKSNMASSVEVSDSVRFVTDTDRGFLLEVERGAAFTLNAYGARVWERLLRGDTLAEIAVEASLAAGISQEKATSDLEAFVASLVSRGLVQRA